MTMTPSMPSNTWPACIDAEKNVANTGNPFLTGKSNDDDDDVCEKDTELALTCCQV